MIEDDSTLNAGSPGVPWGPRHVVLGVLLFIASLLVASFLYQQVKEAVDVEPGAEFEFAFLFAITSILMLLASWALGPVLHKTSIATLGLRLPRKRVLFFMALPIPVFLVSLGFTVAYTLVVTALGWHALEPPEPSLGDFEPVGASLIMVFIIVAVLVPFAEEVLFRGFIFPGISNSIGPIKAALVTSVLFALAHQQVGVFIPIFVTGLMLAWLYHKSGSIWPSFIAHGVQNALALAVVAWGLD
ncbi:MAG: CPBP family intramembrane metalloprotease [Dehalococcoidia bacterium]|nr:CPBP family intramembrane metalloprotease [Dehalococcoidia bacterium]